MKRISKFIALCLSIILALSLCACGNKEPVQGALELPATPVADAPVTVTMTEEEHAEMMAAYQLALQDFAFSHVLPDGTEFELLEGFGYMEENAFAICDVDNDGAEELLIQFNTAPMAGLTEYVFHYASGVVSEQMHGFPGNNYYLNNIVLAPWSHNHTYSSDFWPYSVFAYRSATDTYENVAQVEAWDKTVSQVSYHGESRFPSDKDDGSGVVYLMTMDGETRVFNTTEYELWQQLTFGGSADQFLPNEDASHATGTAPLHDIPWQDMTEQNINGLVTE